MSAIGTRGWPAAIILATALGPFAPAPAAVDVRLSRESAALTTPEWVEFESVVRNDGSVPTPPLVAHLTVTTLEPGRYVDPEDWSPERTKYVPPLAPGQAVRLAWRVRALLAGEFASVVAVVSPDPGFPAAISAPLRLQVSPHDLLPWSAVIPVAAAVPMLPLALVVFAAAHRRRGQRPPRPAPT